MNIIIERFNKIKSYINLQKLVKPVNIIAVSKTFSISHIQPLIDFGHNHFGENKVQEASAKWTEIKNVTKGLKLHMIGKLQSNKAKEAVKTFDYIHSLDSQKLADILAKTQNDCNKNLKYFIQVNIGNEMQKSGISVSELDPFYNYCSKEKKLDILGLMVIPPNDKDNKKYFKSLSELNNSLALNDLSMGMSADYMDAINFGSTYVRIGSLIFGKRS
jgi:pyridoxal phosphate enzyme (YggS family)